MSWLPSDPLLRVLLGLSVCVLLLLASQARSWTLIRRLRIEQTGAAARLAEQALSLESFRQRLERVEIVRDAQESDARSRHEEDVIEVLDSLLNFNESLRPATPASRSGVST